MSNFFNKFKTKNKKTLLTIIILCFVLALISNFIFEYAQMLGSLYGTFCWVIKNIKNFLISIIFIFSIYLFMAAVMGNIFIGSILSFALLSCIAFANMKKLQVLGEPLYPVDFYQIRNAGTLINMIGGNIIILVIFGIIIAFAIFKFIIKLLPKIHLRVFGRVILAAVSLFFIYSYINYNSSFVKNYYLKAGVQEVLWNQPENYNENGFIFALLDNIKSQVMDKPINYNEDEVKKIAEKYKNEAEKVNKDRDASNSIQPNIIFIMDEAFWDPTRMNSLSFSEDPMKNIRSAMADNSSGWLLSPVFGGGTANTEYEALTGFSMYNNIAGTIPYQQAMDNKKFIPSIVSILEDQNYDTLAIHAYKKVFYKRDIAYKAFGFNNFIGDSDMKYQNTLIKNGYISDQSVVNEILDQLNQRNQPTFIHAVTMQNHFPFSGWEYPKNTVSVSGLKDDALTNELETYTQDIKSTDEAMKTLFDGLSKIDKPTIVVFFGDHLPALNNSIYDEAKYGRGDDKLADEKALSETPLLIYSNFGLKGEDLKTVSPAFLGVTLFDMLNKPLSPYYTMLEDLKSHFPGLKSSVMVDPNGDIKTSISEDEKGLLEDYKLLQYDLMVGKQYSLPILFGK